MQTKHRCGAAHSQTVELISLRPAKAEIPTGTTKATGTGNRRRYAVSAAVWMVAIAAMGTLGWTRPSDSSPANDAANRTLFAPVGHVAGVAVSAPRPEQEALVEWAVDRFNQAGLTVPPVHVTVHDGFEGCQGNAGLYRPASQRIHLCVLDDVDSTVARLTTLHELAHAWAEATLDDARKAEILSLRNLEVWIDPDVPSRMWGAEHVAEILSWGLIDRPVRIVRIDDAQPEQLAAAYEAIVGQPPLEAHRNTWYTKTDGSERPTGSCTASEPPHVVRPA